MEATPSPCTFSFRGDSVWFDQRDRRRCRECEPCLDRWILDSLAPVLDSGVDIHASDRDIGGALN